MRLECDGFGIIAPPCRLMLAPVRRHDGASRYAAEQTKRRRQFALGLQVGVVGGVNAVRDRAKPPRIIAGRFREFPISANRALGLRSPTFAFIP